MHVTLVTCRFDPTCGVFDDAPLHACTRDKVILDVREYFHTHGSLPHLTFVLTYRLVPPSAPDGSSGKLGGKRDRTAPSTDDLRRGLAPEQRELFDLLRDWRNRTAREEGIPAYAVLTNKQLLALVRERPSTRRGLQRVEGLGKKKSQRYGQAILSITGKDEAPGADGEPNEHRAGKPRAEAAATAEASA